MVLKNGRRSNGFSLLELLVVVVIVGILCSIALPNFVGAQNKAKLVQVKANMHSAQIASESYATATAGIYAANSTDFSVFYPNGSGAIGGASGNYPDNPFTGTPDTPAAGSISNVAAARSQPGGTVTGSPGNIQYNPIADGTGTNSAYAIVGMDDGGKSVCGDSGKQLVLSNQ